MDAAVLEPRLLAAIAVALFAVGAIGISAVLLVREAERAQAGRRVKRALDGSLNGSLSGTKASAADSAGAAGYAAADVLAGPATGPGNAAGASAAPRLAAHWLDTKFGQRVVTDEDRRLIDQCGYPSLAGQQWFLTARIGLAMLLPLAGQIVSPASAHALMQLAILFALGFMAPKWFLVWRSGERKKQVRRELPLYVDILRLLQGVGLSLDQSLQILGADFKDILRVLGPETEQANRQYSQGRTREHSLQRLASLHDNEHLANLVALLVQVDRHGGAVQEPLRQFSERLREWRKYEMKERIGKITVKMTVVMITTLLPALLIITAGPGFIGVVRSLGAIGK